ncbi:hypothetical protein [Streptomyces sp. NBC_00989]|uniref:hypothetical protein n=1 Tax=Streptomyces sp. NBC_00989 TaxID=2903705 RepID=UPI00386D6EB8
MDSTLVQCSRSRETVKRSDPAGDRVQVLRQPQPLLLGPAPAPGGERERPGAALFKPLRQVIASTNETFKGQPYLERHRERTPGGVISRVMQRILALTAAI